MRIFEVFPSLQGEGKYIGLWQIFVRFSGCNMKCEYCDTEESLNAGANKASFYDLSGNLLDQEANPVSEKRFIELMDKFYDKNIKDYHSVSFTGGEPLLYAENIKNISDFFKEKGLEIFLETNGTLPNNLNKIIDSIDIVSMDLKLSSQTKEREFFEEHRDFIRLCEEHNKEYYVKLTAGNDFTKEELDFIKDLKKVMKKPELYLQPIFGKIDSIAELKKISDIFIQMGFAVKLIPQMHKYLNFR